ncbi:hypothetical protein GCM10014715_56330 [Streptomyces spiralis]|uniref:Uncharacterized protein n=1 Tax=Streptomyces spiralis TaxID=66376 RepID=A0A919A8P7_9ACTN|nr:hypothetical protein [Streptomyces spiralis]GHE92621.1 hypothetical protein GCM10014715_56330 [Streptomyces spiralis]
MGSLVASSGKLAPRETYVVLRRSVLSLVTVAGLAMSALTAPAVAVTPATAAAYPTSRVYVSDSAGSYISGTLTWYNRSVDFTGTMKSVGCRRAWYSVFDGYANSLGARSSSTHCDTVTSVPATLPADVVGGGSYVGVCLDDANGKPVTSCGVYPRP